MTVHAIHGDREAILDGDCERCLEQANNLPSLDNGKFARLWAEMIRVEHEDGFYRNQTEKIAIRSLWHLAIMVERFGGNPWRPFRQVIGG